MNKYFYVVAFTLFNKKQVKFTLFKKKTIYSIRGKFHNKKKQFTLTKLRKTQVSTPHHSHIYYKGLHNSIMSLTRVEPRWGG